VGRDHRRRCHGLHCRYKYKHYTLTAYIYVKMNSTSSVFVFSKQAVYVQDK
jgi:hypothetical protein